ncbi:hypothetical protein OG625_30480 [Streptomyces sp. NBC_01351]|uniref:hypothetical protein n=1 Tax=Streptomyces sp. NBC_01351 TaxID=2903833 RepID=UPI002E30F26C|nr:hypothetical protein [Streptomyces sp. NBC_01351]
MFGVLAFEGDDQPAVETAHCLHCRGAIDWISCPTGGWWAHDSHPADHHDAEPEPNPH